MSVGEYICEVADTTYSVCASVWKHSVMVLFFVCLLPLAILLLALTATSKLTKHAAEFVENVGESWLDFGEAVSGYRR